MIPPKSPIWPTEPKKEIIDVLKKHGILKEKETGKIIIHCSSGGITKITKPDIDILK